MLAENQKGQQGGGLRITKMDMYGYQVRVGGLCGRKGTQDGCRRRSLGIGKKDNR